MATDLGKVGMVMKGSWNSSAAYEVMDVVSYNGSTYIAKQAVPANTAPTNTTYWQPAISTRGIRTINFNSSNPIVVSYPSSSTTYYSFIAKSGLLQGVGHILYMVVVNDTTVTVYNIFTGSTVTGSTFSASVSGGIVTITTTYASPSYVDIIV